MKMYAYLNFGGNCADAFRFYEQHLGGKITSMMKWNEMPDAEKHTPPGFSEAILHARMELGETFIMASDVPGYQPMRSAYLSLSVASSQEAERIYNVLSEGGEVYMKMARPSSRIASGSSATSSAPTGWSSTRKPWDDAWSLEEA